MAFKDHYYIGKIVRLHSFKGEVYARLDVDHPSQYLEMGSVFLNIENKLVPFFIDSSRFGSKGMLRLKFEDVDSEDEAKRLLKKELYLPLSFLPAKEDDDFYFHEIIDFKIIDKTTGIIGKVSEILEYPGNELMKVENGDQDVLIPINDTFIIEVDKKEKTIHVDLPEGLLDLND
ncbi:MAG: 16S rRNA processing protein RimM [Flavobacteriales bacterium]|nr:16S rRNA processing protein RimM [Flavobacteriales bacterium]